MSEYSLPFYVLPVTEYDQVEYVAIEVYAARISDNLTPKACTKFTDPVSKTEPCKIVRTGSKQMFELHAVPKVPKYRPSFFLDIDGCEPGVATIVNDDGWLSPWFYRNELIVERYDHTALGKFVVPIYFVSNVGIAVLLSDLLKGDVSALVADSGQEFADSYLESFKKWAEVNLVQTAPSIINNDGAIHASHHTR